METRNSAPEERGSPAMFGTLLASRPKRNLRSAVSTTIGSIFVHALVICGLVVATMKAAEAPRDNEKMILTQLAPRIEPPPILPPPVNDVAPIVASAPVPFGFRELPSPDVVPNVFPLEVPGASVRAEDYIPLGKPGGSPGGDPKARPDDPALAPFFTPMDVRPKLLNQAEVEKVISRNYPAILRDAGVAGRTNVWIRIDENGKPVSWEVKTSSGFDALDSAAVRVIPSLKFSPAMNQDRKIPVWIQMDIMFKIN